MRKTKLYCDRCKKSIGELDNDIDIHKRLLSVWIRNYLDAAGSSDSEYQSQDICDECIIKFLNIILGTRGIEQVRELFLQFLKKEKID